MSVHTCSYLCMRPECIRAQRDQLAAENEKLRADAERYRWLRERNEFLFDDATIDAARSKE